MRNKFDFLVGQIKENADVLIITETKRDELFPVGQFTILGFCHFRKDCNQWGEGLMVFLREDIPTKLLSISQEPVERILIELNFLKKKWLLFSGIAINISQFLEIARRNLDLYSADYVI